VKFGSHEILVLSDGHFRLDGGAMFGVIPKTLWERCMPADNRNRITLAMNCLLIQTAGKNVLVETGAGDKFDAKRRDIYGIGPGERLLDSLRKAGLSADDVDIVINTHLHFDHCGWNTHRDGDGQVVPTFPRARYYVQRGEYEHACQPTERDRASYLPENFEPLMAREQLVLLAGEDEIVPGVDVVRVPGHTRDMQCVRVSAEGRTAFFFADLVPTTAHLSNPWIMGYDLYPLITLEQKKMWLPQALEQKWLCLFAHDPLTPAAYLREQAGQLVAEPAEEFVAAP